MTNAWIVKHHPVYDGETYHVAELFDSEERAIAFAERKNAERRDEFETAVVVEEAEVEWEYGGPATKPFLLGELNYVPGETR